MKFNCDTVLLDTLCPMHLILGGDGTVLHAGPTLRKIAPQLAGAQAEFFSHFVVKRPKSVTSMRDLTRKPGAKLHLALRADPDSDLKAVAVPLHGDSETVVLNLSFGISILDAVRRHGLTNGDFAPTDLAIEMLYMIEAKSAAMDASQRLNLKLQGARIAAEEQAFTDTLTGLKNRRALNHVLSRLVTAKAGFAVMQIDLDFFKAVNDTLGHPAGDHVLQEVARIMVEETRAADTIARVGGDEFTVILRDVEDRQTLQQIGSRLIDRLEKPILFQGKPCRISASIGTVWIRENQITIAEDVLSRADQALYRSKKAGRARQTIIDPLSEIESLVSMERSTDQVWDQDTSGSP